MMGPEDYKVLPLALVGAVQGVLRYYVVRPAIERFHASIEARMPSQAELDQYIGEIAASIEKL